jgi:hypothetical protein
MNGRFAPEAVDRSWSAPSGISGIDVDDLGLSRDPGEFQQAVTLFQYHRSR